MNPRLNPYQAAPAAMRALAALENYMQHSGLDHSLIDFVKTRASRVQKEGGFAFRFVFS
jgi:hypothetical protein